MSNSFNNYGSISSAPSDFNFSPTEFFSLKENVHSSIIYIKSRILKFEKVFKIIGSNKDSQALREKMKQAQITTNQKIQSTNKDLHRLSFIVTRGDKQQKVQVQMLISEYRNIVEKYFAIQKSVSQRLKLSLLVSDDNMESNGNNSGGMDSGMDYKQNDLKEYDLEFEKTMLLQREQDFLNIETDISNINQMMNEISSLTNQQGEAVDTIENSVEQGVENIERGAEELEKAMSYQRKFKRKLFWILLVLIIITSLVLFFVFKK